MEQGDVEVTLWHGWWYANIWVDGEWRHIYGHPSKQRVMQYLAEGDHGLALISKHKAEKSAS